MATEWKPIEEHPSYYAGMEPPRVLLFCAERGWEPGRVYRWSDEEISAKAESYVGNWKWTHYAEITAPEPSP